MEKPSAQNASFVIPTPFGAGINQVHHDEMVAPIFGPNAAFWETSLCQAISYFSTTTTVTANFTTHG